MSLQLVIHWKKEVFSKLEQLSHINAKKRSQMYKKWRFNMMILAFRACNKRKTFYSYLVAIISSAVIVQRRYLTVQLVAHQSSRRSKSTSDILILDCLQYKSNNHFNFLRDLKTFLTSLFLSSCIYVLECADSRYNNSLFKV